MESTRDNFPAKIVDVLKKRAAFICSNPTCKCMTIAPSIEDEDKVQYIGVAAHITAASIGGPRYDLELTQDERQAITNAIFLCSNCATMIDKNNGLDYTVDDLNDWKSQHEKWVRNNLNKSITNLPDNYSVNSSNQTGGITANIVNLNNSSQIDPKLEHDKLIFLEANSIFNEDDLNKILNSMLGDESIWSTDQDKLENLKFYYQKFSNNYLNDEIESTKSDFKESLDKLISFLGKEFDMFPYNQPMADGFRACLNPKLNVDRLGTGGAEENRQHTALYNALREIAERFEMDYIKYRKRSK